MGDTTLPDLPLRSLAQADGRRREVRTYRRLRRQLIADSGGSESVSAARLAVIDTLSQAAALQRVEFARYVAEPQHDPARFIALSNAVIGAARTLGLARVPKDLTTLQEYLSKPPEKPFEPTKLGDPRLPS